MNWRGTKLIERVDWAKQNLTPHQTEYCVVYEDVDMDCAAIMHPDPHCMAMLMHGGLMPPAWAKLKVRQDAATNGHLLHETEPEGPLTEEEAIEYLIMKDIPEHVWRDYETANKPRLVICRKDQLPQKRTWRNAWRIKEDINTLQEKVA